MKKFFTTSEYKRQQAIRWNKANKFHFREYKRKLNHRRHRLAERIKKNSYYADNVVIHKKEKFSEILVPKNFSLFNNYDTMLDFYDAIYLSIQQDRPIFCNFEQVTHLTAESIIYFLSSVSYFEATSNQKFMGNYPSDSKCKEMLMQVGFGNYVNTNIKVSKEDDNILRIENGVLANPEVADMVLTFSESKLGIEPDLQSESIYATIMECMGNTKHHAYKQGQNYYKWWLFCVYDQPTNKVKFTFLDNGLGIPNTIRKNYREKLFDLKEAFLSRKDEGKTQDAFLIESTLKGEFRTRMTTPGRGRGLPSIYEFSNNNLIDELVIISNNGLVNCSTNEKKELTRRFNGTLLSWNFKLNADA